MEHWIVGAYIVLQCLHILTSNPSLQGPWDTVLLGVQGIGNWSKDWFVQYCQSLHALHGAAYQIWPHCYIISRRNDTGWGTNSRRVDVIPHGSISIWIHWGSWLALLFQW